ncbi:ferritin-like domain-containing protein [Sporomusa termitida]|uniref:Rubrerythrin n=1 Tax=Sporomusa termitida TaxID=2377 RepID=A0A517E139_9FIRM|nr:ferritin-like domain-containing protein [Sporomusa termitida]QDR83298.1 hypothetical protein SPTER_47810 [Sporomusa termitida]
MAMFRARKNKPKVLAETTSACPIEACPSDPDLLLLRDAAADERTAIALYLDAARNSCMPQLFLDIAATEMEHYVEIMRAISRLDPVQATLLRAAGLDLLVMTRPLFPSKSKAAKASMVADSQITLPDRKEMPTINLLTQALNGEFLATNKYQRYMLTAENTDVQLLFCHLMNEEKEHITEFTAALFELTNEPLPLAHD